MASSSPTAAADLGALGLAALPGPPLTPTSLLGLPEPWLLQLVTCSALDRSSALVNLFRTCTFFRDAVLRHYDANASFLLPIAEERFPAEVERLSTVAKRSSRVKLRFEGEEPELDLPTRVWTHTEPQITHLLVCAMAQLEGERPLACVKEVTALFLEQTSLVPAWVKVLCPNATKMSIGLNTLAPHPLHQPRPHQHLQQLKWDRPWRANQDPPLAEHMRQQLAALPSLTSLTLADMDWAKQEEGTEQQAGRLVSSSVTRLQLTHNSLTGFPRARASLAALRRLPTQFPNLRDLTMASIDLQDDGLEALLQGLPHLERLSVSSLRLAHSHAHRAARWALLSVNKLDVDTLARLPLDGIQECRLLVRSLRPSADAAGVARVAQAVRRWGGLGFYDVLSWTFGGGDVNALLTTLGPLVAALPAGQQRQIGIPGLRDVTPQQLRRLGQQLPPGVTSLCLTFNGLTADACSALLPSLPATVEELDLTFMVPFVPEEQVLVLCQAAVRPVTVKVPRHCVRDPSGLTQEQVERIRGALAAGGGQGLVTLEAEHSNRHSAPSMFGWMRPL